MVDEQNQKLFKVWSALLKKPCTSHTNLKTLLNLFVIMYVKKPNLILRCSDAEKWINSDKYKETI